MTDFNFEWSRIGNIEKGRKNLKSDMPVAVYRLLQYTVTDELKQRYGEEETNDIIRQSGHRAGRAFAQNVLEATDDYDAFISDLQKKFKELKIGILRMEKADLDNLKFVLTISEDVDCSGLPVTGGTVCIYDEGFVAGILSEFFETTFEAVEIDCWATGGLTCRFKACKKQTG
ncbi:MAG: V4R domain-containing protein [Christensenellales bacterium]|jgi:predicted hydrocarbon binding protein